MADALRLRPLLAMTGVLPGVEEVGVFERGAVAPDLVAVGRADLGVVIVGVVSETDRAWLAPRQLPSPVVVIRTDVGSRDLATICSFTLFASPGICCALG